MEEEYNYMNNPYISIIVPVYKVEKYIRECIESIVSQKGTWELILVDDGSLDGCPAICDEFAEKDERVQVIHKKNGGVSTARNAGLDVARGEWIWFVDSDDITNFQYEKIEKAVRSIKGEPDYIMFDIQTFNDGASPKLNDVCNDVSEIEDNIDKNNFLLKHICAYHQCLWYRRDAIEKIHLRFTQGLRTGEDGEFQFKYLMVCKHPVYIHYNIYYYRKREGSAMQNPETRKHIVEDTQIVFNHYLTFMKENNIVLEPWLKIRLVGTMKILLYSSFVSGQYKLKVFQRNIRRIMNSYNKKGYGPFSGMLMRLAYFSIPLYCTILKINLRMKGIKI